MATDTRNRATGAHAAAADRHDRDRTWTSRSHGTHDYSPFSLMRQGIDEMDRWFSRLTGATGTGSNWTPSASGGGWMSQLSEIGQRMKGDWSPAIEAFQRGDEFLVRAEVPGMTRNDLDVEVNDDSIMIRGQRQPEEHQAERDGVFWTERSYGSFCRVIPLPSGAIGDSAKATFTNGVLEVVLKAPSAEARRGRKIDISGGGGASATTKP